MDKIFRSDLVSRWLTVVLIVLIFFSPKVTRAEVQVEQDEGIAHVKEVASAVTQTAAKDAAEGKIEEPPFEDHWAIFWSIIPESTIRNFKIMLGRSFVEGKPVGKVGHIFAGLCVFIIILGFVIAARKKLSHPEDCVLPEKKLSPFTFFDLLINALLSMMTDLMGEKYARKALPLIGTFALFIFFSNILGMVPGFLSPTDTLNTTIAMSIITFLMTHYYGIREHGINYFKHFLGPIIKWYALPLMMLMLLIELVSHFVRPVSLAVRLMGNIFGDHTVLLVFVGFGITFIPLPIMLLGLLVSVVQTLVFCLLSMVYFSMAVAHEEHGEEHH